LIDIVMRESATLGSISKWTFWHDYPGEQVVEAQFGLAEVKSIRYARGKPVVFEPKWTGGLG
jgi:hypothetical protein